jgi:TonB family protein
VRAAQEAEEALNLRADFPAAASLLGDSLLKLYAAESARINEKYPMPPDATEETRKPVFEKRQAALEPFNARMRAAADRQEAVTNSQPNTASSRELAEMAETLRVYGDASRARTAQVFRQAEVTTKALITYKPEPGFTERARQENVAGVIRLRAVLAADGRVKHILVIKGLPHGLTEKAVEAARRIRFTPATVEGRPVSQFVVLEYNFNIY